jgi:hypothetical protein
VLQLRYSFYQAPNLIVQQFANNKGRVNSPFIVLKLQAIKLEEA